MEHRFYPEYSRYLSWIDRGPSKEELFKSLALPARDEDNLVTFSLREEKEIKVRIRSLTQADEDGEQYHFTAIEYGDCRPRKGFYDTSHCNFGYIEKLGV